MKDNDYIEFEILEVLNKEWTAFLETVPTQMGDSVAEGNTIFASRRAVWMRKMSVKYRVTMSLLSKHFVH